VAGWGTESPDPRVHFPQGILVGGRWNGTAEICLKSRGGTVDGWLIVRQGAKPLFTDRLKDATGEIALTPSDAPYTFVLRKGTQEDVVLTVKDLLETDVPTVLESTQLGIKLVATVEDPQPEPNPGPG